MATPPPQGGWPPYAIATYLLLGETPSLLFEQGTQLVALPLGERVAAQSGLRSTNDSSDSEQNGFETATSLLVAQNL